MGNLKKCSATGKVIFENKKDALAKIHKNKTITSYKTGQRVNRLRRKRNEKRCYWCEFCDGWHLTSQDYKVVKSIKEQKRRNIKNYLDVTEI